MLLRLKEGAHSSGRSRRVIVPRPCAVCSHFTLLAAEADNAEKQRLSKESAEREKLEAEERKQQEEAERLLDQELNAKAKAEARDRMAQEAELRKKRMSEREASGRVSGSAAQPASPSVVKRSPGTASGGASPLSPSAGNGPTSPSGFSTGDYDDDDEDEPLPGDRVRSQIPRQDVLETLHAQAKANAKSKAEAWRGERDAARKEAEAKAAAKAEAELRLAKAASELKKQQEEDKKAKAQAEAKAKAETIAAMMSKLNEPELNVPEAAEGAFTYAQLKELSTKEAMRDAGILCVLVPCHMFSWRVALTRRAQVDQARVLPVGRRVFGGHGDAQAGVLRHAGMEAG